MARGLLGRAGTRRRRSRTAAPGTPTRRTRSPVKEGTGSRTAEIGAETAQLKGRSEAEACSCAVSVTLDAAALRYTLDNEDLLVLPSFGIVAPTFTRPTRHPSICPGATSTSPRSCTAARRSRRTAPCRSSPRRTCTPGSPTSGTRARPLSSGRRAGPAPRGRNECGPLLIDLRAHSGLTQGSLGTPGACRTRRTTQTSPGASSGQSPRIHTIDISWLSFSLRLTRQVTWAGLSQP